MHHDHPHASRTEEDLALKLDLEAELFASYLNQLAALIADAAEPRPRTVLDLGAGTGAGSLVLAHRFSRATVVAVDTSEVLLERLRVKAVEQRVEGRVHTVHADLDVSWPDGEPFDLIVALSSMHHFAQPQAVLARALRALSPTGLFVLAEPDGPVHQAQIENGWGKHLDWGAALDNAGFASVRHERILTPRSAHRAWLARPSLPMNGGSR